MLLTLKRFGNQFAIGKIVGHDSVGKYVQSIYPI